MVWVMVVVVEVVEKERGKSCVPFPGVDVVVDFLGTIEYAGAF